jgi:mono/diheme cytochrome c family protein
MCRKTGHRFPWPVESPQPGRFVLKLSLAALALMQLLPAATVSPSDFTQTIRPVLAENCGMCHNPAKPRGPANFLKAQTAKDMQTDRGLWHNVAAQLRNRTMPPVANKLSEEDRLRVAMWIDTELRETACSGGDYAGATPFRRLNRREYHNTIRDLLGIDFDVSLIFPADGTGGSGFDTSGETLYIPPVLMERYLSSAQQILDRVVITPPLAKAFKPGNVAANAEYEMKIPVYIDGDYAVVASQEGVESPPKLILKIDGVPAGNLVGRNVRSGVVTRKSALTKATEARNLSRLQVRLTRGDHVLSIGAGESAALITTVNIDQIPEVPSPEKRALHYRLLGTEPGETPLQPRQAARQVLTSFLPRAFRRPVETAEIDQFMKLYDRSAQRGDPYTESVKLTLRGVLLWPDFLFHLEKRNSAAGIHPLGQYELASRLSYFLWSTVPDDQLTRLADQGRLQDTAVLKAQVERMLDDPRSRTFVDTFVGQWLGTQDLGGRVAPMLTELLSYYNPDVAADLRAEPILLFGRIVAENRSLLELLNADYTYMTERLVKFYQLEGKVDVHGNDFQLVKWPDNRRAGVTGMGAVLAMTSHYEQTSPVLRGAWALETLLGTPVPPPPPNVPPLDPDRKLKQMSVRQKLEQHRADPTCAACHKLMDPIGFALENFDWMGRWRDKESNGQALDTSGELPSGEKFNGPVELRQTLLNRKDDFLRHLTSKVLGYALGRGLQDGDSCTVQHLVDDLAKNNYQARTLITDVVLSIPFRNTQGGNIRVEAPISSAPKRQRPMVTK